MLWILNSMCNFLSELVSEVSHCSTADDTAQNATIPPTKPALHTLQNPCAVSSHHKCINMLLSPEFFRLVQHCSLCPPPLQPSPHCHSPEANAKMRPSPLHHCSMLWSGHPSFCLRTALLWRDHVWSFPTELLVLCLCFCAFTVCILRERTSGTLWTGSSALVLLTDNHRRGRPGVGFLPFVLVVKWENTQTSPITTGDLAKKVRFFAVTSRGWGLTY